MRAAFAFHHRYLNWQCLERHTRDQKWMCGLRRWMISRKIASRALQTIQQSHNNVRWLLLYWVNILNGKDHRTNQALPNILNDTADLFITTDDLPVPQPPIGCKPREREFFFLKISLNIFKLPIWTYLLLSSKKALHFNLIFGLIKVSFD